MTLGPFLGYFLFYSIFQNILFVCLFIFSTWKVVHQIFPSFKLRREIGKILKTKIWNFESKIKIVSNLELAFPVSRIELPVLAKSIKLGRNSRIILRILSKVENGYYDFVFTIMLRNSVFWLVQNVSIFGLFMMVSYFQCYHISKTRVNM